MEYTAVGDAVNLAGRMEQTARPGTVQISAATYKLVEQVMGQRLGERAHLERAEAIFAEMGAELDLARVRRRM